MGRKESRELRYLRRKVIELAIERDLLEAALEDLQRALRHSQPGVV